LVLNTGYAVWTTISLLRGLALDNCGCDGRFFPNRFDGIPRSKIWRWRACVMLYENLLDEGSIPIDTFF